MPLDCAFPGELAHPIWSNRWARKLQSNLLQQPSFSYPIGPWLHGCGRDYLISTASIGGLPGKVFYIGNPSLYVASFPVCSDVRREVSLLSVVTTSCPETSPRLLRVTASISLQVGATTNAIWYSAKQKQCPFPLQLVRSNRGAGSSSGQNGIISLMLRSAR